MRPLPSRRLVLSAGAGAVGVLGASLLGVEEGVLPGRSRLFHTLRLDGPDGVVPAVDAGPRVSGSFVSRARGGRRSGWTIGYPPGQGGARLPVVVV
ncbi:MAG: esterase, partial [Nocardioidaceae bacterium]|nr:esterase [Nocardioidaceae bacterium]